MRLSDMSSDKVVDILLEILPDVEEIIEDENLQTAWAKIRSGKGPALKAAAELLKGHRDAVWSILGAISGKTEQEVGEQPMLETLRQIADVITDQEMISFFTSLAS